MEALHEEKLFGHSAWDQENGSDRKEVTHSGESPTIEV